MPPTEPTLEALARDALRACLQPDAPLGVRVAAIPFVLPRITPAPPTPDAAGKPTGHTAVDIWVDANGLAHEGTPPGARPPA